MLGEAEGRKIGVYKVLRAAGVPYVPAKEAMLSVMTDHERAGHEKLLEEAERVLRSES